jgi:hypothetical protein
MELTNKYPGVFINLLSSIVAFIYVIVNSQNDQISMMAGRERATVGRNNDVR